METIKTALCWIAIAALAATMLWVMQAEMPEVENPTQGEQPRRPDPPELAELTEPCVYETTYEVPIMAARTAVEMGTIWNFTFNFPNPDKHLASNGKDSSITASVLGMSATIATRGAEQLAPQEHDPNIGWFGEYLNIQITVGAPGMVTDTAYFSLWLRDIPGPDNPTPPPRYDVITSLTDVQFTCEVDGLYLKRVRTSTPPINRQLMDFSDQTISDSWYADEGTTVTITALCPDSSTISAQGALGGSGEVEIGSLWYLNLGMTVSQAPEADTVEARIGSINWGDTALDLSQVDLWKPGKAGTDPNGDGWCREKQGDAYHVSAGANIEMSHTAGVTTDETWSGAVGAPYIVSWAPLDGMTDAHGPSYGVEYTSNAIEWKDNGA